MREVAVDYVQHVRLMTPEAGIASKWPAELNAQGLALFGQLQTTYGVKVMNVADPIA